MIFEWDEKKSQKNVSERGLPFDAAKDMDFSTAYYEEDDRKDYGERRFVAYGFIEDRLHFLCFTPIPGGIRVISLRKANKRESRYYEQETEALDE